MPIKRSHSIGNAARFPSPQAFFSVEGRTRGSRSGHGLVVCRDDGGRWSVLFVQMDPVDLRRATDGFELRRHVDQPRMLRGHYCQSRVYVLGNMAVLLFGVVV